MTALATHQIAEGVLAQLRAVGPQTIAEIQADLALTKKQTEDAIRLLMIRGRIEYDYPSRSPLAYRVAVMREP